MSHEHPLASATAEKLQQRGSLSPAVDIYENRDEILVIADLPGSTKEDVSLNFDKGKLTIEARRAEAVDATPGPGSALPDWRRTFLVPQGIDTDKIAAELEAGVLRVHLPKSAALRPRTIEVRGG